MTNFIDPAPFSFKVAEAKPSYKKIRPVLLLNVAIGLALSHFFTIVVFALADMIRRLKMVA